MGVRGLLRKVGGVGDVSGGASPMSDAEKLALFQSLEENEVAWFWATDDQGRLIYLSPGALAKLGEDALALGMPLTTIVETTDQNGEIGGERPLSFFMGSRSKIQDQTVRLKDQRREVWWSLSGRPVNDRSGSFIGFRGSAKDITSQFAKHRDESRMAQFDALTGLANRHRMTTRLESTLTAFRAAKRSCALLMMDLDKFKHVNDSLGHPAGDELLRQVADRLQKIVPEPAEIGRLGGDEFQIIIPDADDRGQLGELAGQIIKMLSQPYSLNGDRAAIGASVGIAVAPYDGVTMDELVESADLALYAAKGGGRGQYRFYGVELASAAARQREIGEELRHAADRDELLLHYQPIVGAKDHQVVAFEALLRWHHPDLGMIPPETFLPIAEDLQIMGKLGEWVIRRACQDASEWPGDIRVAVNVTGQQFASGNFLELIEDSLKSSGMRPGRLELEITENVFLGDQALVDAIFKRLFRMGVRLTLDDFGTGYGSLGNLRRAPFDRIKIDQSFVRNAVEPDSANAAIITSIVSLAEALSIETVAEGVEAMDELKMVNERGADFVQGFIYSRPIPHEEVLGRLDAGEFTYEPVGPDKQRSDRRTLFRRIGVIHEDHRYDAVLRNLSRTGAMIEGLLDVPVGTDLVLDLGEGQLAVATVRRSQDATQGVEFETPLISDGAQGLCTRYRLSPYALAAAGMPLESLSGQTKTSVLQSVPKTPPRFLQVDVHSGANRAA